MVKNFKRFSVCLLCAFTVFLFAGCSSPGSGPNYQDLSAMIEANLSKVVSIEVFNNATPQPNEGMYCGSGVIFYATPTYSLIATNAHVVRGDYGFYNYFRIINWSSDLCNGREVTGQYISPRMAISDSTVIYFNNTNEDIAIIKYTPPEGYRNRQASLRDLSTSPLRVGEPVAALGYTLGAYLRTSVGVVSQVMPEYRGVDENDVVKTFKNIFAHDATTLPGNSGGPVFDVAGKIIGLTTMVALVESTEDRIYVPASGVSLAISSWHITEACKKPAVAQWIS